MAKRIVPLSDADVRNAKPGEKDFKKSDGGGLYLLVTAKGGKFWRYDYRYLGKRKTLALGVYDDVSLSSARERLKAARKLLADGIDPGEQKKADRAKKLSMQANTFEKLARSWHHHRSAELAEKTRTNIMSRLERDVFPKIGDKPLGDLTPAVILHNVLTPVHDRGAVEVAHRIRSIISMILRYGIAQQVCERDLTADLRGALKPIPKGHYSALEVAGVPDANRVGGLLRSIDTYDGNFIVKCALRLHPLVVTRPGELRHAEWVEFDLDAALWSIPAGRMKMKKAHLVPLSKQAVAILRELQPLTGSGKFLFPCVRSAARPISDNTLNAALRRMGYTSDDIVSHGWRAVFRTLADEVLQVRVEYIEAQLAHKVADVHGRAYNRTAFLKQRKAMMQRWADYLDTLKASTGA